MHSSPYISLPRSLSIVYFTSTKFWKNNDISSASGVVLSYSNVPKSLAAGALWKLTTLRQTPGRLGRRQALSPRSHHSRPSGTSTVAPSARPFQHPALVFTSNTTLVLSQYTVAIFIVRKLWTGFGRKYQWYISRDIYHDNIMIFISVEKIMIYINENITLY